MIRASGGSLEENIVKSTLLIASSVLVSLLVGTSVALAQDDDDDEDPVLGAVVQSAPVTLEQGIAASAREGTPISGKFEMEVDGVQLSVYTTKDGGFSEVIVDHRNGKVEKVVPIVDGKDLVEARTQVDMMRQAGQPLEYITSRALKSYGGYRAVSATPARGGERGGGPPVVKVVLTNGKDWKSVYVSLSGEE
jgi:hypothetical protein